MSLELDQHIDTVTCRVCGEKKVKTFGKVAPNKRVIWVDQFGERWYGRKCPNCYRKYKDEYDQERRKELGYRPLGSVSACSECGKNYVVRLGSTKMCHECNTIHLNNVRSSER